ncbi:6-phosphogluconolactonase [Puia sp. P3]|uniref:6-phosphogluconolactonase n=1 Tax=Puia sp. P3 TaxID=3423952 RepID=UPI003D67B6F1
MDNRPYQYYAEKRDRFTIALSGGSTPRALHKLLAAAPYKDQIDWSKMHIFWGDERAVPFEDDRNNAKMAYETLLNFVTVPASQIHVMRTDIGPDESAAEYEKILHQYFDSIPGAATLPNSFDLVLLGMGDDGHTLSLPGIAGSYTRRKPGQRRSGCPRRTCPVSPSQRLSSTRLLISLS